METTNQLMIIGLSGAAGSGKTTLADALIELGWTRMSFAEPIKKMLSALLESTGADKDAIEHYLNGHLKNQTCPHLNGLTIRHAMQTLGTEWGRMSMNGIWMNIAEKRIKQFISYGHHMDKI